MNKHKTYITKGEKRFSKGGGVEMIFQDNIHPCNQRKITEFVDHRYLPMTKIKIFFLPEILHLAVSLV